MKNQTLEQQTEKIATCLGCGNPYDIQKRREEVEDYIDKETAAKYCDDPCWIFKMSQESKDPHFFY